MTIEVRDLSKRFEQFTALDKVSFTVPSGELVALLGPSGGGKSTILRIISGLDSADAGDVLLEGERVDHLHPRERRVGFVFQHYALFRHMTVAANIAFGLEVQKIPSEQQKARVDELLQLIGLTGMGKRFPEQLSGGQRQRVALARALAPAPRLLLLDEPFGAVDAKVRTELRRWLRRLHDETHVTSVFVTHDQEEAFAVADRVIVVNQGRVEQVGTPAEILESPASEFVARFVGDVNVVEGAVVVNGRARAGVLTAPATGMPDGARVRLVIRSYDLKFWRDDAGIAVVERMIPLGDRVRVEVEVEGVGHLFAQFPRRSSLLKGVEPGCRINIEVTLARPYRMVA